MKKIFVFLATTADKWLSYTKGIYIVGNKKVVIK